MAYYNNLAYPNYYNTPYWNQSMNSYSTGYNMSGAAMPQQNIEGAIKWVDGEAAAKAYQMPSGTLPGTKIALWDTNDTVIYLKSINPMGMPNPLQKIRYVIEDMPQQNLPENQSGDTKPAENYVTKEELDQLREEIQDMVKNRQNGSNYNGNDRNRGGNSNVKPSV